MQPTRRLTLAGVAAVLLATASPQARAQDADFSQQQIEAFAVAATDMQRLKTELEAQARDAANQDEILRLQQQAQADATRIVEDSGLSVDEYSAIVEAANQDAGLYATIVDLMQQRAQR